MDVWVGVRVDGAQTLAASWRLAGMSSERQEQRLADSVCGSDCRIDCLADRVLSQLNTEYQICDTKFIIRVTYTRTW